MVPARVAQWLVILLCISGFNPMSVPQAKAADSQQSDANDFLIVHCLLPGQIRQLGRQTTYVSARRPEKTSALDCRVRGGEYVRHDHASLGTAMRAWLTRAQGGDAEAQATLGELFEQGVGGKADYVAARSWYLQAAQQEHSAAQIALGTLLERGLGGAVDQAQALDWYRRAASLPESLGSSFALDDRGDVLPLGALQEQQQSALNAELESLQAQNKALEQALVASRQALDDVQAGNAGKDVQINAQVQDLERRLAKRSVAVADLTRQLADETLSSAALERLLNDTDVQRKAASATFEAITLVQTADHAELQQTLVRLQENEEQLAQKVTEIRRLSAALSELETNVASNTVSTLETLAAPTIAIVNPTLKAGATRGLVRVAVPSVVTNTAQQQLVGRVDAPAGLLTLTVNGEQLPTNAHGVFETKLSIGTTQRAITIVAIDQRGQRSDLEFVLEPQAVASTPVDTGRMETLPADVRLGNYHALLIGNNRHASLPNLETPIRDVRKLQVLLQQRYGFRTQVLENASRYEILSALNALRARLTSNDNLLIYYAGHGEVDQANARGHWLPVDAAPDSTANWLSNVDVTDILNVMKARQVLLVADSCYSGTLTRSAISRLDTAMTIREKHSWLRLMADKRARVVLTSGGLEPVLDFGGGDHSVFAAAFIGALSENREILPGRALHQAVAARVAHAAARYEFEQMPEYAPIGRAGHEAGDFIMLPR